MESDFTQNEIQEQMTNAQFCKPPNIKMESNGSLNIEKAQKAR
jgi:hypothetical protein